eukprot:CAMPEP_0119516998 /NCGR_PEP_ID=MMETSP1344-20130328/34028_1 /TAXON_ID=236787 /ORGANISM="Florenciella parvula, Strain CCMP2471" /LENGTH=113 /DNA_ID=CAMNT_0007554547 /DNA_START=291 /DNA_END=633 /DNA_ORIENTATION=-
MDHPLGHGAYREHGADALGVGLDLLVRKEAIGVRVHPRHDVLHRRLNVLHLGGAAIRTERGDRLADFELLDLPVGVRVHRGEELVGARHRRAAVADYIGTGQAEQADSSSSGQ